MELAEKRRRKGRENRERIAEVRQQKADGTYTLKHESEVTSGPRMPTTQKEMQMHLSGRHPHLFRNPVNRRERRQWDRYWKLKGVGFTKPAKKGERF